MPINPDYADPLASRHAADLDLDPARGSATLAVLGGQTFKARQAGMGLPVSHQTDLALVKRNRVRYWS